MRRKNDVVIKYFQLANTMFLTNEEFGALIRKIIIEDDKNEIRYENLDEETKEDLKELEKQWKEDFKNIRKKNTLVGMANASVSMQVRNSTKAFNKLLEDINNKKNGKETEKTTTETTAEETEQRDYSYSEDGNIILTIKAYEEIQRQGLNIEDIEDYMIANIDDFNNDCLTILDVIAQYKEEKSMPF